MLETEETQVRPRLGKIAWRRKWQPCLLFLPGESQGQRSLVGYLTKGGKALDMSDWADTEEEETVSDGRTGREIEQSGLQARPRIG